MRPRLFQIALCMALAIVVASGTHLEAADSAKRAADEQAIEKTALAYLEALNRNDYAAVARFWVADGEHIDPDGQVTPIAEVLKSRQAAADDNATPVKRTQAQERRLRFVTDDVALEEGISVSAGADHFSQQRGRYAVVWVRQKGEWKLSSLRDIGPERSTADPLAELDWLTGHWVGKLEDRTFEFDSEWVQSRRFLLRRFTLKAGSETVLSGTQVIGWNPLTQQIRSWVFDSEGGFSEASWERVADVWHLQSSGVRADGVPTEALNTYTRLAEDRFEWRSLDLSGAGGDSPELVVQFERQGTKR